MLDQQQIESASAKLVQFIQDLTTNIQRSLLNETTAENFQDLFLLRADYARQLANLFDVLVSRILEQFLLKQPTPTAFNLDPVHFWRTIQMAVDQGNALQRPDLAVILKQIRNINNYSYNLLCHLKNIEFLKVDQTRAFNRSLHDELHCLADSLTHWTRKCHAPSAPPPRQMAEPIREPPLVSNTYLFQPSSLQNCSNNNHPQSNDGVPTAAMSSNCYPCHTRLRMPVQQTPCTGFGRSGYPSPPTTARCPAVTIPMVGICPPYSGKPMGCGLGSGKTEPPPPLCFPTPVVYTPEMETLFSSGGIIYARKSGNTWVAENLGTLIDTLKDIGENLEMGEHCEILIRKTGDLLVRRKRGRRKRLLQEAVNKSTPRGNNAYDETNLDQLESTSTASNDDVEDEKMNDH